MKHPLPQFRARICFAFNEHDNGRRRWFMFGKDGYRRVPMKMEGVDSMYTVEMRRDGEAKFEEGDETDVDCRVICPEVFNEIVKEGVSFELWDGSFFADGVVTQRYEECWKLT